MHISTLLYKALTGKGAGVRVLEQVGKKWVGQKQ